MSRKLNKSLLAALLLAGSLFACDNTNVTETPSESLSENVNSSETIPSDTSSPSEGASETIPSDTSSPSEGSSETTPSDTSSPSEELSMLLEAKTEAISSLDTYLDLSNYRVAQQEEIAAIISAAKLSIEQATTISDVETLLATAKTQLDAVKTDAQLTQQENEEALAALQQAKSEATVSLESYLDLSNYRVAQQEEIASIIFAAKSSIEQATTISDVETLLATAKTQLDAVKTDAQLSAEELKITTSFEDGQVFTSTRATLDVIVKDSNGNKLSASKVVVKVNGQVVSVNWDDNVKTSYNFIFQEGENVIEITATDNDKTTTKTYTVIVDSEKAATITVSIEAFTVGLGYIVEPINFVLDEENMSNMASNYGYSSVEEFKEKLSMAHILDYVLTIYGYEMSYQGSLESTWNGFYMSSISGLDITSIYVPDALYEQLDLNGFYVDEEIYDSSTLCEFDYTWGSGWMYMVNGSFPNIPFCDYVPQDGDVMRVQFTLSYGADIGDWGIMGEPFFEFVDRETLTKLIATALEKGIDVTSFVEVVSTFGVTQEELDVACSELLALING